MSYNIASVLERSAAKYPDRPAVVFNGTRLDYAQVDAAANQVANLLVSLGIEAGDKVALSCPNLPQFTFVYFGILKAGATVVPLNALLKAREIAYHLEDSAAKAYFCFQGTAELPMGAEGHAGFRAATDCAHFFMIAADPTLPVVDVGATGTVPTLAEAMRRQPASLESVETDEDATAVIMYTSGTTGEPKGAELRHRNLRDNIACGRELFGSDESDPDTYLGVMPLFHSFGQAIQNIAFMYGGSIVMVPRFEPDAALATMLDERVNFMAGVPTVYWGILEALKRRDDGVALKKHLEVAVSGGAPLPIELHREFERTLGISILEGYGLSETSPMASFGRLGQTPKVGSVGVPLPGVEMKLIDPEGWDEIPWTPDAVGEVAIRGHNIMKGYFRRPEATAEAIDPHGWFRTGDLGRRDEDGCYYIVGRAKEMIIRGGFNVYSREIEEVLHTHPDVSLAAVIGVPHETHGEEVKAYVILNNGASISDVELREWGKEQMASYKYPRIVEIVDALPMTATGKVLKRELS